MPFVSGGPQNGDRNCSICTSVISEIQNHLKCDICSNLFHMHCASIHGAHINRVANEKLWYCKSCKINIENPESDAGGKRKADDDVNGTTTNISKKQNIGNPIDMCEKLDKLFHRLEEMDSKNNDTRVEIKNMIETVKSDIQVVKDNQNNISSQIGNIQDKINSLNTDNLDLKNQLQSSNITQVKHGELITELQIEIESLKQKENENDVIISGLPSNINPDTFVSKIFSNLQCDVTVKDIKKLKILMKKKDLVDTSTNTNSQKQFSSLLVSFNKRSDKEKICIKMKDRKTLFLGELGLLNESEKDRRIYIRNNLTKYKHNLFEKCKTFKDSHNIKFLWITGNKILMRQNESSKIFAIHNEDDLKKFEKNILI